MRKKNKLYTVNQHNKRLFADGGLKYSVSDLGKPISAPSSSPNLSTSLSANAQKSYNDYLSKQAGGSGMSLGKAAGIASAASTIHGAAGISEEDVFNNLDPFYHFGKNYTHGVKVGNTMHKLGQGVFKAGLASGNPYVMLAGGVIQLGGSLSNAMFGYGAKGEQVANDNIARLGKVNFSGDNDALVQQFSNTNLGTIKTIGQNGWATNKGTELANQLNTDQAHLRASVWNSADTLADSNNRNQLYTMKKNYHAFGGGINGALDYGLVNGYINARQNNYGQNKVTSMPNSFGSYGTFGNMFAEGGMMDGTLQSHGANWSNGATQINTSGTHEENPQEGVQLGVDEQGTPDMVEEGEVVFNDYVYSNRLVCPKQIRQKFGIRGNKDITFAEVAKKLTKESEERPNDPISEAGLKDNMELLAQAQEQIKQAKEAEEARAAFEAMSPEQQMAVMQQMQQQAQAEAQQQQMAEEQAAQEQGPSPEEQAVMEEQAAQEEQAQQAQAAQEQEVQAEEQQQQSEAQTAAAQQVMQQAAQQASQPNTYAMGGFLKGFAKAMNLHTEADVQKWAKDNGIENFLVRDGNGDLDIDTKILLTDKGYDAIAKKNPTFAHSLRAGNRFQTYTEKPEDLTFDFNNGSWTNYNYEDWKDSNDPMIQEAKDKLHDGMTREEFENVLKETNAYKRGTEWLKDEANSLKYLNAILKSEAPQAAKDYASKFVKDGKWIEGVNHAYSDVYDKVRNTFPGTYWKNLPIMARENIVKNFVKDKDGNITEAIDTTGLKSLNTPYQWSDENGNYTYNYYEAPTSAEDAAKEDENNGKKKYVPKYKDDRWKYASIFGPAVGLGLQLSGVGKPDYRRLDAAASSMGVTPIHAQVERIGGYYNPDLFDEDYTLNKQAATARGGIRALQNSGLGAGLGASVIAANNNYLGSIGDTHVKAREYNDAQKLKGAQFNLGIDEANAQFGNQAHNQFAQDWNNQKRYLAQMQYQAAKDRMDADASWYNSLYGNVGQLFANIGALGKENAQHNMIADMAAQDVFGTVDPGSPLTGRYVQWPTYAAYGGRIRKKGRRK